MAKQKINQYQRMNDDGWQISPSGSYKTATSLMFAPGLISGIISAGTLIKLDNDSATKYFKVTGVAADSGSNNIVYLEGVNNATLANSAVTNIYHSNGQNPIGFGADMIGSRFKTSSGSTLCATSVATSAVALASPGVYIATAWIDANEANNPYFETALISTDGTTRSKVTILQDGTTMAIGMSNLNMTLTQNSGITLTVKWSVMRIA